MWLTTGRRASALRLGVPVLAVVALAACSAQPSGTGAAASTGQTPPAATGSSQTTASPSASVSGSPTPAGSSTPASHRPSPSPTHRAATASLQPCLHTILVGYSVRHRTITACERGTPGGVALVVVGVIHGNERLGLGVVDRLRRRTVPAGVDLWTITAVNPDGLAAGTRQNAHHVDLNRNWPGSWQPSSPGSATYGGPSAASEPETRALRDFLLHLRPRTVVVFHSPLDAVDFSEGADPAVTRYLAAASGYPARTLGARPGSFTGWFNGQPWGGTAVTFEFGSSASSGQLDRVARALLQLAAWRRG